jgi:hypothetical protein
MAYRTYKPCLASLVESLLLDLSTSVTGLALAYFFYDRIGWPILLAPGVGILLTLKGLLSTIWVHLQSISLDDKGLTLHFIGRSYPINWDQILAVTLRERQNRITRTDRLLVFKLINARTVPYNVSVLSTRAQQELLAAIRPRVQVSTISDKASL